jgi:hypothetical protein
MRKAVFVAIVLGALCRPCAAEAEEILIGQFLWEEDFGFPAFSVTNDTTGLSIEGLFTDIRILADDGAPYAFDPSFADPGGSATYFDFDGYFLGSSATLFLTFQNTTLSSFLAGPGFVGLYFNSDTTATPVPEPSTLLLFVTGLAAARVVRHVKDPSKTPRLPS